ncbi:shikimate O-hydroxycinnamoyltransferase [Salvia miltiorrhiza]|uniref:shikimate O-hydroxycinnamoyltransferase n=1 Tax=Salvia miltiorrhiza TaxID=226208 RepID=UPI0025AD9147|nr:shikimate O-hydroxycinnamoyltransferase [Salvia miltiorrhiza]
MANSGVNGGKVRVEGIQTVVPTKPTDPRQLSSRIAATVISSTAALQRRFHVVLCYNKASSDDSGWVVAGRIKESLGRAMQEQPLLAGRLRWCQETDNFLQIVSNDSGARLVESKAEMELGAFVAMEEKREALAQLVFWEDLLHHTPHFSPLFYVQVTNFRCGGYSIGISCSLLLADPFALTAIIKKWANLHSKLVSTNEIPQIPTFYLPNHGTPPSSPSLLMGSNTAKDAAESVIFKIPAKVLDSDSKNLAALCVQEAERDVGRELAPSLSLLVKVTSSDEDDRVEAWSRQGLLECLKLGYSVNGMRCARTWDELGLDSICFSEGNKPVYASCWINSVVDEGSVIVVPSVDQGVQVVVTYT